ncbi:MAG: protein kinase [Acidobacteriota bacterium]
MPRRSRTSQWLRLKGLFNEALDLPPNARGDFVDSVRRETPTLADDLVSLLSSHEETGTLFAETAAQLVAGAQDPADAPPDPHALIGTTVGQFRLNKLIGQGGMGAVYLASRTDGFDQQVAIKLVQGSDPRPLTRQRFLDERQILAHLAHPNIAHLLDGGALEDPEQSLDVPYLVMEYIEGEPIDTYCASERLPFRDRLKLLATVCSAVHFAHQKLIVHRDLKPGNILVTADGAPKLLDFGIAKLLNPDQTPAEGRTRAAQAPMTPEFASPEQFLGEPASTASDIYSLGVLGHYLLVGHSPYRTVGPTLAELSRVVCTQDCETPSNRLDDVPDGGLEGFAESADELRRRLSGDIDAILLKALAKDPMARYASAADLALDIERHLDGLPVRARGDHFPYVASRWLVRRRGWVAAGALVLLSLAGGVGVALQQARVATQERARAEQRFNDVRRLANDFLFDFHDAIADLPGSTEAREMVVSRAFTYLELLADAKNNEPGLRLELADAYVRVGDVQGQPGKASLGDTRGALHSYQKALAMLDALDGSVEPQVVDGRRVVALRRIGQLLRLQGDAPAAEQTLRDGLELADELRPKLTEPADLERLDLESSEIWVALGRLLYNARRLEEANDAYASALEIRRRRVGGDPDNLIWRNRLAAAYTRAGDPYLVSGDLQQAIASYRNALDIDAELVELEPHNRDFAHSLMGDHSSLATAFVETGEPQRALLHLTDAIDIGERLVAADSRDVRALRSISILNSQHSDVLFALDRFGDGLQSALRALELRRRLTAIDPADARARREVGVSYYKIGFAWIARAQAAGDARERKAAYLKAQAMLEPCLELFLGMREDGSLQGRDATVPAEIREKLKTVAQGLAAVGP